MPVMWMGNVNMYILLCFPSYVSPFKGHWFPVPIDNETFFGPSVPSRVQLKCDGTRWRTGGKWRGNWQMEWVASTLLTTSELGVSSITTADAHTSAVSSRLNWHPCRFKWTHLFRQKMKSGFCACTITFQMQSSTFKDYWLPFTKEK